MLKIKRIINDLLAENTYILINKNDCLIVDPGSNYDEILKNIGDLNVIGILITHYHFDHIDSLDKLKDKYKINELSFKTTDLEHISISSFFFDIIKTPGHTSDSITFYFKDENIMFTGDFLFKDSIGRYDLPTGDFNDMIKSLDRIKKYSRDIIIYPGHGDQTTLGYEIDNNYYMK